MRHSRQTQGLRSACRRFSADYREWAHLVDSQVAPASFVPYEALLADPDACMRRVAAELGLPEASPVALPAGVVLPTHWDDAATCEHYEPFAPEYYRNHEYREQLGAFVSELVSESIDWELFARWGYGPG